MSTDQRPSKTLSISEGELWSLVRSLISQGTAIQMDAHAGKYPTSEHVFARIDEAARERSDEIVSKYSAHEPSARFTGAPLDACENCGQYIDKHSCSVSPPSANPSDLVTALAHRAVGNQEQDLQNGKLAGYCIVCQVPWPCDTAKHFLRPVSPPSVVTTKHIDAALMALAWVDQYMSGGSFMLARENLNIAISNLRGGHCETASGATVPPSADWRSILTQVRAEIISNSGLRNEYQDFDAALALIDQGLGLTKSAVPKICTECADTRVVFVDGEPMPCPDCCCSNCGVPPGEAHYRSCSAEGEGNAL